MPKTAMPRAFVSYSHADSALAEELAERLRAADVDVWLDGDSLHAGDIWRVQIDAGLATADAVVVLLSAASDQSKYVTYEWGYGFASGATLILLRLDATTEGHPRLSHLQHIDFSDPGQRDWYAVISEVKRTRNATLVRTQVLAEAAADLAIEGFAALLQERYEAMTGTWPGNANPFGSPPPHSRTINAFGHMIVSPTAGELGPAVLELRKLLSQALEYRRQREATNFARMVDTYRETWQDLPGVAQQLAVFTLHGKSLGTLWHNVLQAGENFLQELLPDTVMFEAARLQELRRFFEEHPAWANLRGELAADLDMLCARGTRECRTLIGDLSGRMRDKIRDELSAVAAATAAAKP